MPKTNLNIPLTVDSVPFSPCIYLGSVVGKMVNILLYLKTLKASKII